MIDTYSHILTIPIHSHTCTHEYTYPFSDILTASDVTYILVHTHLLLYILIHTYTYLTVTKKRIEIGVHFQHIEQCSNSTHLSVTSNAYDMCGSMSMVSIVKYEYGVYNEYV